MTGVDGVVLTGGRSRRFGRDKAMEPVDGVAMAVRVAAALRAGGAERVTAVGGDAERLAAMGLPVWPDDHPGDGPLGGVLTALGRVVSTVVVVAACDLPWLTGEAVAAVLGALAAGGDAADVAVARTDRLEPLLAAWRVGPCRPVALAAHASGERAVHRVLAGLRVVEVPLPAGSLRNVNHPEDLRR